MGLTVHYTISLPGRRKKADVEAAMRGLYDHALSLYQMGALAEEPKLRYFTAEELEKLNVRNKESWSEADQEWSWALIQAGASVKWEYAYKGWTGDKIKGERWIDVRPLEGWLLKAWPGAGCEECNFVLMRYPSTVEINDPRLSALTGKKTLKTGKSGWTGSSFCKTQYASRYGLGHFIRSHVSVLSLCEAAQTLGFDVDVYDESHFWEHRDLNALIDDIGHWNRLIAGLFGTLSSALPEGASIQGPIQDYPDFEYLEQAGLEENATLANIMRQAGGVAKQERDAMARSTVATNDEALTWMSWMFDKLESQRQDNPKIETMLNFFGEHFEGQYPSQIPQQAYDNLIAMIKDYQAAAFV